MTATLIDGTAVSAAVREELAAEVARFTGRIGRPPGLATVLVGNDPASEVYVGMKRRRCAEVGISDHHRHLPADATEEQVANVLHTLNADPQVSGILLQLPLPGPLDGAVLTSQISPWKDVDGLTSISAGRLAQNTPGLRPCTPLGVIELLDRYGIAIEGANAVVVGRSDLVGKPVAQLLLHRNATVTICHSRTRDLAEVCAQGDILIAAVGRPEMLGAEHVKPGAAVIDVGINRVSAEDTESGSRLVGDVNFDAVAERAGWLTPVPGGVGPMTIAMLLRNTLTAAELQARAD